MEFKHISVLLDETIEELHIKPDGIYVDGTLGGGGHAFEVCSRLNEQGRFIGIDQDAAAIEAASERLRDFGEKVTIIRSNYCEMKSLEIVVNHTEENKQEDLTEYRLDYIHIL